MKFVISTQELNYLINKCLSIVSQKPAMPILSNLLIEAVNHELIVTSTDLTVGVRCFTEAKILEEGATTLPAKKLAQLLRELTAVNLEVTTHANEITEIVADSSRFKLHGMKKQDFPSLPDLTDTIQFQVKQKDLKDALYRTSFAVSREDNRYVLTGILLHIENSIATFVGTDGKRLARALLPIEVDRTCHGDFIIPIKAVEEILKNLSEEGDVTASLMPDKIGIKTKDSTIVTKLLTGDYPDVARVIPQSTDIIVALHREELTTLLRQISLFTVENNQSVRFTFSNGELRLSANSMEVGEGKVSMPANYHGPKLDVAFNPNFFLDILRHSKNETVTVGITDSYNPGVITDNDMPELITQEATPLFVLMPMRLNDDS